MTFGRSKGVELRSTLGFRYALASADQLAAPNELTVAIAEVTRTCGGNSALSLYDEALAEALRHKWIESQKHGRDLGDSALKDWFRRHWLPFCRVCRLEHIEGMQRWVEFAEHDFGQVYHLLCSGDLLLDRILDRMELGYDNLEIINWALTWKLPMPRVLELLEMIDINRARLEPLAVSE
jgi:hypothetical protein